MEDLRDSSTDQVRWQTRLESWIKAQQPVEEASESKTLDGTNGTCQNSLPFQDFELSLQKKTPFFALSWTRTSEFHQRLGLMTTCKNLVIIWVTFPQLGASEVMNLTSMKGELFKLAQTSFRPEHNLSILGSTANIKPVGVSIWKPI